MSTALSLSRQHEPAALHAVIAMLLVEGSLALMQEPKHLQTSNSHSPYHCVCCLLGSSQLGAMSTALSLSRQHEPEALHAVVAMLEGL